jgi:hypothetical protein
MIVNKDHYTQCELMRTPGFTDPITHEKHGPSFCVCAWFWDIASPTYYCEISVDKNGKPCTISDDNFPDVPHEHEPSKDDVPKNCPKGYTWEQIDAKMKVLEPSFFNEVLTWLKTSFNL